MPLPVRRLGIDARAQGTEGCLPLPERSRRVLVMDDEEMIREITGAMLDNPGCETVGVCGGAQAVEPCRAAMEGGIPFTR